MRAVWKRPGKVPGICLILCKMGCWRAVEDCIEISYSKGSNCLLHPTGVSETEPQPKVTMSSSFGPETQTICTACSRSHISV